MQTLYAFSNDPEITDNERKQFLSVSMNKMYDLYLVMLALLIEVQLKAKDYLNKAQKKHLATEQEKNPSKKFINNRLLRLLVQNQLLHQKLESGKLNVWKYDDEYVDLIFKALLNSDPYQQYMKDPSISFYNDKEFIIQIYKTIIAPNDKLFDYLEDKNITWVDDVPVVNTTILKLMRKAGPKSSDHHFLPDLFKDMEDRKFGFDLLLKTRMNLEDYTVEIAEKTQNWDQDRITNIDMVLLQMAICELKVFSSIPLKVTINEYLEIAKEYSTPKSSVFINGILDKIVKEYSDKGTLNKTGRGLL